MADITTVISQIEHGDPTAADGDYINQAGPFQLVDTMVQYQITNLSVTPVPEAGPISSLLAGLAMVARRRTRGQFCVLNA